MRDYDVTIALALHGRDADASERLLNALVEAAPDMRPVVEQNLRTGALSARLTVPAQDAAGARERASAIFDALVCVRCHGEPSVGV